MTTLKVHYDGKVLVPEEPVDLPVNCPLDVLVTPRESHERKNERPLLDLAKALSAIPANPDWPADGAAQHDHYLYGLPKRP